MSNTTTNRKERLQQLEAENRALRAEVVRLRKLIRREVYAGDTSQLPYSRLEDEARERAKVAERKFLFGPDWRPAKRERISHDNHA